MDEAYLTDYLQDVALLTNLDAKKNDPDADRVTLSTIHQAKGMEWPVVLVPWCSEGLFQSAKAVEEGRPDEERRLFYVVVTRAKDHLYLFCPQMRKMSDGGMFPVDPSMFVKEIPSELVQVKRVMALPDGYAGGGYSRPSGGYGGSSAGYGGGYGAGRPGYGSDRPHYSYGTGSSSRRTTPKPTTVIKKTWRH